MHGCSLGTLTDIQAAGLASEFSQIDPWLRLGIGEQELLGLMRSEADSTTHAIVSEGELAGLAIIRHNWLFGDYLKIFAVRIPLQHRGLGRISLELICSDVRTRGGANLWACVSSFNNSALSFYMKIGFEPIGKLHDLVKMGEDEILIRRRL